MTNDSPPASATLLLLRDDPFEVLMVRRNSRGTFASSLVFPGGAADPEDFAESWEPFIEDFADFDAAERGRRICAIRETWEETSILAGSTDGAIHSAGDPSGLAFRDFLARSDARLRLASLTPLAHWITPETEPRRFDTRFFVARAPVHQVERVDGAEIVEARWVEPVEAARAARAGEWPIIFPTLMNLDRLAESDGVEAAIEAARARPAFTVQPVVVTMDDGSNQIVIPAEAGYAVTRFTP